MPELSYAEGEVLATVRKQCRHGDYVTTDTIRRFTPAINYDGVQRALKGLVAKGMVEKPSRGVYVLPSDGRSAREEGEHGR